MDPIAWLLEGDPAIRWQVMRDLKQRPESEVERERNKIARTGWGRQLLDLQAADGTWAGGLYTPKFTSSTYTLLLLRAMGLPQNNQGARKGASKLLNAGLYKDGGFNLWAPRRTVSETCVTGMALQIASHFQPAGDHRERLVAHLLDQQMDDGGWNCRRFRGDTHSSLHTTISVLEGLLDYENAGGSQPVRQARERAHEFLYAHRMYRSHRTGKIIDERMTRFAFPTQWHYDVLRGLEYLQAARAPRDPRLADAIALVHKHRSPDGTWALQNFYSGQYHFRMETPKKASRWNTLRALRVLAWWSGDTLTEA
jgi:hypothetical protein